MVRDPAVFLLDEPLANLDAKLRASMRTEIRKLHQRLGTTFVYVTHDQTEAMTMGDLIVVMKDGFIQQADTPQTLYSRPCNVFVASFIGSTQMNFLDGVLRRDGKDYYVEINKDKLLLDALSADGSNGALAAFEGKPVKVGIRPEDLYDDADFLSGHPNSVIDVEVEVSEQMGSEIYLYLIYGAANLIARVTPDSASRAGAQIRIGVDTRKLHLFDPETEKTIMNIGG
jgi:multiple sugar transport system ATP-binding protein